MKKLSTLLRQRESLLRQARLANLAAAYQTLSDFAARIDRARLGGRVTLTHVAPEADRFWPTLIALDGSQSVIEEHFTDEDLLELADVVAFIAGHEVFPATFQLEGLADQFLAPLRTELAREGVVLDASPVRIDSPEHP